MQVPTSVAALRESAVAAGAGGAFGLALLADAGGERQERVRRSLASHGDALLPARADVHPAVREMRRVGRGARLNAGQLVRASVGAIAREGSAGAVVETSSCFRVVKPGEDTHLAGRGIRPLEDLRNAGVHVVALKAEHRAGRNGKRPQEIRRVLPIVRLEEGCRRGGREAWVERYLHPRATLV